MKILLFTAREKVGFSATKLNKFQSEPTLATELSQEERILNLIDSFDRFECSDSDDEKILFYVL